jgi:hypothetical protein
MAGESGLFAQREQIRARRWPIPAYVEKVKGKNLDLDIGVVIIP